MLETEKYKLICGDCLSELKKMDNQSVNCIITSPPYWAMRKYDNNEDANDIGNEDSYIEYVKNLTSVFSEAKRVLTDNGSLWLNLGDKYNDKALMGMPWRVAISLMDDGWILRNDVIWNQMKGTQSCKDRLRDMYEHFFHFVKSKKYYYNADEIKLKPNLKPKKVNGKMVSATGVSGKKYRQMIIDSEELNETEKNNALKALDDILLKIQSGEVNDFRMTIRGVQRAWHSDDVQISGRAKELKEKGFYIMKMGASGFLPGDIWNIVPEDTWRKDSHCAVFPEELLRIPILATCPGGGVVLDPFSGTGSTVSAALKLGRKGIGIDLSNEYNSIAENRIKQIDNTLF